MNFFVGMVTGVFFTLFVIYAVYSRNPTPMDDDYDPYL